ncbi:hypothetical protein BC829DRAFT_37445 [Chytridium lagenaria]|nr:hypothetical protein BC829DRAFT_37445 [Chytridium lagenaria]
MFNYTSKASGFNFLATKTKQIITLHSSPVNSADHGQKASTALVSDTVGDGIPANVDGVLEQQFPSNLEDIIDADSRRRRLTWTQLSIARSSNGIPTERARLSVLRRQQEGQERLDEVYQLRQVEDLRGSIDNLQEPTDSEDEAESWGDEVREEDLHHFQEGNDDNSDGFAVSIPMRFHTFQAVKSRGRWHTGMSYAEEQKNELVEFEALRFKLLEAFLPFYMTDNKDKSYNELPKAVTCECDTCANSTQPPSRYSIPVLGSVGLETIRITACIGDISLPCLLLMNGIMPSSALKPAPGFSILKMVKAERDRRVLKKAFESIFASTFYDDFTINFGSKDPFYRNFLVAIRELLILRHMTWHGRLVKAVVDKTRSRPYKVSV